MQDAWFPDERKLTSTLWDRFVDCNYGGLTTLVVILSIACWLYVLSRRRFGILLWPIGILSLSPLLIGHITLRRSLERTASNIEGWHMGMDAAGQYRTLQTIERDLDGAWFDCASNVVLCVIFLIGLLIRHRAPAS